MEVSTEIRDIIVQRRLQYLRILAYRVSPSALVFALLAFWLVHPLPALFLAACGVLSLFVPKVAERTGSPQIAGHYYMFVLLGSLSAISWTTGGLTSPAVYALTMGPPVSVLILSRRASIFWVSCVAIQLIIMGVLHHQSVEVMQLLSPADHRLFLALGVVSVVLILYVLLLDYQSALDAQSASITQSRGLLSHARDGVETAARALMQAELVANDSEEQSLAPRMHEKSQKGRAALSTAKEQIATLGHAQSDIAPRIESLRKQSASIHVHLQTLNRISEKLDTMSVNTAIEAAHAEKHGVNFGPLAQEMRRLSELATNEIHAIRGGIKDVAAQAAQVGAAADRSTRASAATSESLDELTNTLEEMLRLFRQSTQATHEVRKLGREQLQTLKTLLESDPS